MSSTSKILYSRWLLALLLVTATALIWFFLSQRPQTVSTVRVKRQDIVQTILASARVEPSARVHLGSLILGQVRRVAVEEGQEVKAGQVLIELVDDEAQAAVKQARAAMSAAQTRLEQICDINAPRAMHDLKKADLELEQARTNFERDQKLFEAGTLTESQFEKRRTALLIKRSAQEQSALNALNNSCQGTERRLAVSALMQNEANLNAAMARLAQTVLSAPGPGVVLQRTVEVGDIVQPGKSLLQIALGGPTRIAMQIDEKDLGALTIGQNATVSAEAFPQKSFQAKLARIAPLVDPQRGTIEVILLVEQAPDYLRSDMTVSVELEVARHKDALVLPQAAVREASSSKPWALIVKNGHAERRDLSLGLKSSAAFEILSGLEQGDQVIMPGDYFIKVGQAVTSQTQADQPG